TLIKAGYIDEEDRVSGVSNVIGHMLSTRTVSASTDYDRTVFSSVVSSSGITAALDAQAAALLQPSFDSDALKREVEIILEENRDESDKPSIAARQKLYETAFVAHRMKRQRSGIAESLGALTPDDVLAYYKTYYRPSNMIVTIVGAVDRERVL